MINKRQYSWPDNHWNWPIALTHQHGVRAGNFVFTGGQADLDELGRVQHPYDVPRQVESVTNYLLAILHDLDTDTNDLVRLVVYFVGGSEIEAAILDQISTIIGADASPAVNTISVPQLCYPGMVIELEGVAMRGLDRAARKKTDPDKPDANKPDPCNHGRELARQHIRLDSLPALHPGYSHVVVCDDIIFISDMSAIDADGAVVAPDDLLSQSTIMMDQLGIALKAGNAGYADVVKLNVFYVGDGTAENWQQPARLRQSYFNDPGPAATGITLPEFATPGLMTKIAVTAVRSAGAAVASRSRQYSWPQGHWNWTTALPYKHGNRCGRLIHLGGQVSLDSQARVIDPDDIVAQTTRAISNIEKVLAELSATLDHIVKVTTFYEGQASADELHQNLLVRSGAFKKPGPATTGIPVPSLVYENMRVEIEVIAVLDDE